MFALTVRRVESSILVTPEPREKIEQVLLKAEQSIHKGGWDQSPGLACLQQISPAMIRISVLPIEILNPASGYIAFLGENFRDKPELAQGFVEELKYPFQGIAFIYEAWFATRKTREELLALHRGKTALADIPGTQEARMISMIDIWGRIYQVQRLRGEKPVSLPYSDVTGGPVLEGLRQMTLAIARHLPDAQANVAALEALRLVDLDKGLDDFAPREQTAAQKS